MKKSPGDKMALAIEHLCDAVLAYNEAYAEEFEGDVVGVDGYLGEEIANIIRASRALLNGPSDAPTAQLWIVEFSPLQMP